jgi:hypothetical protein
MIKVVTGKQVLVVSTNDTTIVVVETTDGKFTDVDGKEPAEMLKKEHRILSAKVKDIKNDSTKLNILKTLIELNGPIELTDRDGNSYSKKGALEGIITAIDKANEYVTELVGHLEDLEELMLTVGCYKQDVTELSSLWTKTDSAENTTSQEE